MRPDSFIVNIPANETAPAHALHCHSWGDSRLPVLFCAHGLTRNGRDFDFLANALCKEFYVLCPDMPGRGASDWLAAEQYSYPCYLTDIAYLLAQKHITQLHWLGTSMGGILGMMLANQQPGLFHSLILNDVGCLIPKSGLERIAEYASGTLTFATLEEGTSHIRKACASFGIAEDAHWQHVTQHGLVQQADGTWRMHYDPAILTTLAKNEINDVGLWPLWEAIKPIPTLLVRGEQSDILLEDTAREMAHSHPALTRYNIKHCGHAPALMAGDQIEYIRSWLNAQVS